jgi:hypothetical protein
MFSKASAGRAIFSAVFYIRFFGGFADGGELVCLEGVFAKEDEICENVYYNELE